MIALEFSPAPAHVRTARLVAAALARQAGVADEVLDEVRLAVGEACSRAVALHRLHGIDELVAVRFSEPGSPNGRPATTPGRFVVSVTDRAPAAATAEAALALPSAVSLLGSGDDDAAASPDDLAEPAVAVGVGLALLAGLVDDLDVQPAEGTGTVVSMGWPSS